MPNLSKLDEKYFIDTHVYNCPFCRRRNVAFKIKGTTSFHWSDSKLCRALFVICLSCEKESMHLTYNDEIVWHNPSKGGFCFKKEIDIDSEIFYSVPASGFVIDERVPRILRDLLFESSG